MASSESPPPDPETARQQLYNVRNDDDVAVEEILELGCEYLGTVNGHVKRIDDQTNTHEVIASYDREETAVSVGDIHDHDHTYCRFAINQLTPFAVSNASEQGYADDPAYREHGLGCYLGESFAVGGSLYGTVCFVSPEPRSEPFSVEEQSFAELIARTVATEMRATSGNANPEVKSRAVEDASVAISIADATAEPATFSYVNQQFEQLTGYGRETVMGEDFRVLRGPETSEEKLSKFKRQLESNQTYQDNLCLYRQGGSWFWVQLTVTPVSDETGETTHYIAFYQDVMQRRRNERLLAVLNRVVRHNVRNQMSIVSGYVQQLTATEGLEDSTAVKKIHDAVDNLVKLSYTAKRLEKARQDAEEPERLDIVSIVSDVAEQVQSNDPDAHVTVSAPDEQCVLASDRIRIALEELGENARKYAGETPNIEFIVESVTESNLVRVAVSDDGSGLPEPDKGTLQGRPETPLEHGSGLGLFLVYWIVTTHGGYVSVSTDGGATIEIYLRTTRTQPGKIPESDGDDHAGVDYDGTFGSE